MRLKFETSGSDIFIYNEDYRICASLTGQGFRADPPALEQLCKMKPQNQSVQDYIKEMAGKKP